MHKHSNNNINDLLNAPEGDHYEFKEAKNRYDFGEAVKYCCALANCGGGKLVLGISDKRPRKVVSSKAFEQPERTCKGLMEKLRVRVDFQLYEYEGKRVLVFIIASRPSGLPVQADGIAWWRDGDSLVPMPPEVLREIYAETGHDFSGDICLAAKVSDLDNNAIETFRNMWIEHSGNKRIASLTTKQLLTDCGALVGDDVTYAALILFGKNKTLVRHLPQAEIIFEYRSSEASGPAAQREEFCEGFFIRSYDRIWELVNLRNDKQHYQNGFAVHPVNTFNERVVREAVLNAVSHRDYQLGGSIFVRQYNNRLVIESPGGFPLGITVENILNRQSSRNACIARIFQLCGFVERSGQGMNLIYELSVREAKPLPDFNGSDAYFVKLTLNGKIIDSRMLALIKKIGDERLEAMTTDDYILLSVLFHRKGIANIDSSRFNHLSELGVVKRTKRGIELIDGDLTLSSDCQATATSDWQSVETSDRKKQILTFISNNDIVKSSQIAEITGLTQGRVRTILQELVIDGLIEKIGDNRYASYIIKN
jgi:ATP-dependent DNA helicase RecG